MADDAGEAMPELDPARRERFETRWGDATQGVAVTNAETQLVWINPALAEILGRSPVEIVDFLGRSPLELVHPDDLDRVAAAFTGLSAHPGRRGPNIFRAFNATGAPVAVQVAGMNLLDDPDYACLVLDIRAIDDAQRAEAFATEEYEILERIAQGQQFLDTLREITRLAERHLLGTVVSISLIVDGSFQVQVAPNVEPSWVEGLNGLPARPGVTTLGEAMFRADAAIATDLSSDRYWKDLHELVAVHEYRSCWSIPILDSSEDAGVLGTVDFWLTTAAEPTFEQWSMLYLVSRLTSVAVERQRHIDVLRFQATHDPLTGLLNRHGFQEWLQDVLVDTSGADTPVLEPPLPPDGNVAVLFLDLDRFKVVNDTHGHDFGDRLLVSVAERIRGHVPDGAVAARIGGDEFLLACRHMASAEEALRCANELREELAAPYSLESNEIVVRASVGVAIGHLGVDDATDLVRDADTALYRSKDGGRNRCTLFDDALRSTHRLRLDTERDLITALERMELSVHYQPIVEVESGHIVGVEALVRWRHPVRGLLAPDAFVPVAEDTGLIVAMDHWVLAEAQRAVAEWNAARDGDALQLWVNLSQLHLSHPDTISVLRAERRHAGDLVPIGVEITESAIAADPIGATSTVLQLRNLGLDVAIDDFGTGYSSLAALKAFPVTHLKIDRTFVAGLEWDARDMAIVQSVVTLASSLNLQVTAEGVENGAQLQHLRRLGCDRAQGYLFSRPLPAAELAEAFGAGLDRPAFTATPL